LIQPARFRQLDVHALLASREEPYARVRQVIAGLKPHQGVAVDARLLPRKGWAALIKQVLRSGSALLSQVWLRNEETFIERARPR